MNQILKDPVLRDLAEANPVVSATLTATEAERAEALLQSLCPDRAEVTATPGEGAKSPSTKRAWRAGTAAAAVVAAVAATFLGGAPASAEFVLLEAASGAAAQPVPAGQFWYVRIEADDPDTGPYQREMWLSKEGGVMRNEAVAAEAAASAGERALDPGSVRSAELVGDADAESGVGKILFGDGIFLTWDELDALPTEAGALKQLLVDGLPDTGHGPDYDLWHQTVSLLRDSPAGPDLRRALWEVLATVPGVEVLGLTTDHAGREGTAVRADFTDQRLGEETLVLDVSDGTLLETVYVDDTGEWRSTLLEQGTRESAPPADPPICGPGSVPEMSC